jgi:anti-sigma factor RsiW
MAEPAEMACQELVEIVTAYLEDALDPYDRERADAHLALCDGCEAYLEQVRTTIELSGRARLDGLSDGALDALRAAFRSVRPDGA